MQALEVTASITNHRLEICDDALPAEAAKAHVIILWESPSAHGRHTPPPALAGMGEEHGDIVSSAPEGDWEALG